MLSGTASRLRSGCRCQFAGITSVCCTPGSFDRLRFASVGKRGKPALKQSPACPVGNRPLRRVNHRAAGLDTLRTWRTTTHAMALVGRRDDGEIRPPARQRVFSDRELRGGG